ncbi:MAG: hypothetical protein FWH46_00345 [Methanimicrococcus sp.]|nr:hypothetical protein [Methanimicrococcus sp.]
MTVEIVILNSSGVIMAADSVVTSSSAEGVKTYPTANKLFAISYKQPIGIMTYGMSNFINTNWETLIKLFRTRADQKVYKTIQECGEDFIQFIEDSNYFDEESQKAWSTALCLNFHKNMIYEFLGKSMDILAKDGQETNIEEIIEVMAYLFEEKFNEIENFPLSKTENYLEQFSQNDNDDFVAVLAALYQNLYEIFEPQITKLSQYFYKYDYFRSTGVVIAGFGAEEINPKICSLKIIDFRKNKLVYTLEMDDKTKIYPYAQVDMVEFFLAEIDPYCYESIKTIIKNNVLNSDGIINLIDTHLNNNKEPKYAILNSFPLPDLASVAENLIGLTIFNRRFSQNVETVGGAVDVAAISKGDGFVWVKRKQYFEKDLNPHFVAKYYK